jgi:hypothetical protein
MPPTGTPTSLGILKFADGDSPDLGAGGLGAILDSINAAIAAGGFAKIAAAVVGSAALPAPAASLDFQNIPQTYSHLLATWGELRSNGASGSAGANALGLEARCNNDSGTVYNSVIASIAGSAAVNPNAFSGGTYFTDLGLMLGSGAAATESGGGGFALFPSYRSTTQHKGLIAFGVNGWTGNANGVYFTWIAGVWRPAAVAAINRLTFFPEAGSFTAGRLDLYGLA